MQSNIIYEPVVSYIDGGSNDDLSIASSSSSNATADEFTKLKTKRKEQRRNRKLVRSASIISDDQVQSSVTAETLLAESLLTELARASDLATRRAEEDLL